MALNGFPIVRIWACETLSRISQITDENLELSKPNICQPDSHVFMKSYKTVDGFHTPLLGDSLEKQCK